MIPRHHVNLLGPKLGATWCLVATSPKTGPTWITWQTQHKKRVFLLLCPTSCSLYGGWHCAMFPMGPGWAELWPKLPPNKPKLRSHVFGPSWSQVVQVRPWLGPTVGPKQAQVHPASPANILFNFEKPFRNNVVRAVFVAEGRE